ncbi:S-methyl-5'-thioadenosine phosphorylase [candidate division KSB1 bacterium]|nr:S-methyl-5'-thioadenosine phosphorylase [candidate division KSB1 bacterium]
MEPVKIGIIGGSGVYQIEKLTRIEEVEIDTSFGKPSDTIIIGSIAGQRVAFLPRHGRGHRITPTELNSHANIMAMKKLGVEYIISISACGSLREDFAPRHIVIPNQIFDMTKKRNYSFFGNGLVAHIGFAEPFCPNLSQIVYDAVKKTGATVHQGATYLCIEGPRFSTKAESNVYRQWGMDIIGMTAVPEAQLAREAGICYATMGCVTDYDVWREEEESVNVEMLIENLNANARISKQAIQNVIPEIGGERDCECKDALATALITQPEVIPQDTKKKLDLLVSKFL